jgi:hypothetical protein
MLSSHGTARTRAPRSKLNGLNPRNFSRTSRWRFGNERRQRYLTQCGPVPTIEQSALIEDLISQEWDALAAEKLTEANPGHLVAMREAREHRRFFRSLMRDLERTLVIKPLPAPRAPTLAEIVGEASGRGDR